MNTGVESTSYSDLHERYVAAIAWMSTLGIQAGPGRAAHYERLIRYWKDAYETASDQEGREALPDFVSSVFEIFDFVEVHRAFAGIPPAELAHIAAKLRDAVGGPLSAAQETPSSTRARNFLFEAVVAARGHAPELGISTVLDATSDTGLDIENRRIWVECKRVTTPDKIERNVRKAANQLEVLLASKLDSEQRGMIALDVSKIHNRGDLLFVAGDDASLVRSAERMMDEFLSQHSIVWQQLLAQKSRRIIGVLVRLAFMAKSERRNILVRTTQWALNPSVHASKADHDLLHRMTAVLRAKAQT